MTKFDTIWHDAGEREIRAVIMYVVASKLCVDSAGETEAAYADVLDLCQKGFLRIFDTDTFYAPVSFKDATGTLTITYGSGSSPKTVSVTDPLA